MSLSKLLALAAVVFFLLLTFVEAGVFTGGPSWFLGAGLTSLALSWWTA